MKKVSILILIIPLIIGSCTQETRNPVEGAWQLFYYNSGEITYPGEITGSGIKVWTEDCIAFVGKYQQDTLMLDHFGWGKYKWIEDNKYEETVMLHNIAPSREGTTVRLLIEVRNDTLIQRYDADENWNLPEIYQINKYVRVK